MVLALMAQRIGDANPALSKPTEGAN